jgi:hypothetical protein
VRVGRQAGDGGISGTAPAVPGCFEQSLAITRATHDRGAEAYALHALGNSAVDKGASTTPQTASSAA